MSSFLKVSVEKNYIIRYFFSTKTLLVLSIYTYMSTGIVCSNVLEEFSKTFEAVIDAANSISFDLWCPFAITQFPIYYQKQNGVAGGNQSDDFLHFPNKENWQLNTSA